ncbi:MAG TPA: serine hydrolase [Polyangiaceae bacterium]|nr:serine hydrolase [Polyangiaceae bacterium]
MLDRNLFGILLTGLLVGCSSQQNHGVGDGASSGDAGEGDAGAALAIGQKVPFPTQEWTFLSPGDVGMDAALLDQACDYALRFDGNNDGTPDMNTQGVVIVRGGAIVRECYADGKGPDDYATSWSAAKSFVSTLVGIAIDEGLIPGVDVKMSTLFPEWATDERKDIRLEDVLQMQSGLAFREEYSDLSSEIVKLFNSADSNAYVRSLSYGAPAGSRWYYSSGDSQLLGAAIETVTGTPAGDWAKTKLFDPLGIGPFDWWKDGGGHTTTYCCIDTPTRQFAKFGLLALREGNWDGKQIVSKEWIRKATRTVASHNPGYAYQWWTQGSLASDIPEYPDLYWADGLDQQKIFVIPSLDLVVAKNTLYTKPAGGAQAGAGQGVLSKITPRGIFGVDPATGWPKAGTIGPLVWQDVALLAPIVNSIQGATKVDFAPTQLGTRPPDPAQCKELAHTGYGTYCEAVHGCACDACSPQFLDCNQSEGCKAILNCALVSGCRGIACATPCATVIQQYGGTGTGGIEVQMALNLSDCTVKAACATTCN